MRIAVLQPPYPAEGGVAAADHCLDWMLRELARIPAGSQDLLLLPEYANAPGLAERGELRAFASAQGARFLDAVAAEARRIGGRIAVGAVRADAGRWFNRTVMFGPDDRPEFAYDKVHLTLAETEGMDLTPGAAVPVHAMDGVRIGYAVCFDLYFPELFHTLAAAGVDLILAPSYQRSETAERVRLIAQARALDTGAYLVRSSYAMANEAIGGQSLVAGPDGAILANAGGMPGVITAVINPQHKFVKPASHGAPLTEHRALMEKHRRPALYRAAQEVSRALAQAPFPWLCAHRGLSQACPENTLPAFAAAIAAGAHELELDVWISRDGVPVVCHDDRIDRTTDGTGRIAEMDWAELRRRDAGVKTSPAWRGVPIPRLEDVLDLAGRRVGLNIHIKTGGPDGTLLRLLCDRLRDRALLDTAYLACDSEDVLELAQRYAPEVMRCCLAYQADAPRLIATARKHGCRRLQFFREVTAEQVRQAHAAGLVANLFWSDDAQDARQQIAKGIDVILTNCAHQLVADGLAPLPRFGSVAP